MIAPSIPRQLSGETIEDFAKLRGEALSWLSNWCASAPAAGEGRAAETGWSDFNVHDPGVQIVEVVCHALTELAYRARLPILTILQNRRGAIDWKHGAFYSPPEILPMSPLTAADYRKLLLDRFSEIYQVWLESGTNGRHTVWLYFQPGPPEERQRVLQRVDEFLKRYRNLGESFTISPAPEITLTGTLTLTADVDRSAVAAALYQAAQKAIMDRPPFVSIADRQKAGDSLLHILTGPQLKHGSISDESLKPLLSWEQTQACILAAFSQVAGVTVTSSSFTCEGFPSQADPPSPPSPAGLSGPLALGDLSATPLEFHTAAADSTPPPHLHSFSSQPPSTKLIRSPGWTMPKPDPAWSRAALSVFNSLQREFPPNYGLGPDGLPPSSTPLRQAQVKQLRGYLLHFEQLMANYLAQLASLPALFSTQPQKQTCFTQTLYGLPEILPLLKGFNDEELKLSRSAAVARADAYRRNPSNPYRRRLNELNERPIDFLRRRNRFLDHLLARFAESYPAEEGATYDTIRNKEDLLGRLPELGRRRAAATEPADHGARKPRESGLEERITILLQQDLPVPGQTDRPKFYYVVEHGLLTPPESGSPAAQPFVLSHVLENWTVNRLTPAFKDYVESLISEHTGAHLLNQFLWFERPAPPAERSKEFQSFVSLYEAWKTAAAKSDVTANKVAADLLTWLNSPAAPSGDASS